VHSNETIAQIKAHVETPIEERWSCITHAIGAILSVAGLAVLVTLAELRGDLRLVMTVSIYGATLLLVYGASTCYHACRHGGRAKHWLKVVDHIAIYALIAGTYTPFLLVSLRGTWGWSLFAVLWGLAAIGTVFKLFFVHRFDLGSSLVYLAMGWIGLIALRPFLAHLPGGAVAWVLAGGGAYTCGVIFYLWDRLPFNHAIWHIFVMAGSACHFVAVLIYVVP
jgi:hemolysin III